MQKLTRILQSIFCTRFITACKYAHLAHVSRVVYLFSKRACSTARFIKSDPAWISNIVTATRPKYRVRYELYQIQDRRLEFLYVRFSSSVP